MLPSNAYTNNCKDRRLNTDLPRGGGQIDLTSGEAFYLKLFRNTQSALG